MLKTYPIFAKELYEVAGKKNTYAMRVFYAVAIAIGYFFITNELIDAQTPIVQRIGIGGTLYQGLVTTQFFLILIVVPPLVASAITSEKENNTIIHLLTLPSDTFNVLFQKYAGRLIPVISLLLVSLPLFGLAFTFGGVTRYMVFAGTINLVMCAAAVGALSLAVSCYRMTSVRATLETYALLLLLAPSCLSPIVITSYAITPGPILLSSVFALIFTFVCFTTACRHFRERAFSEPEQEEDYVYTGEHAGERPITRLHSGMFRSRHDLPHDHALTWLESSNQVFSQKQFYQICVLILAVFAPIHLTGVRLYLPLFVIPALLFGIALYYLLATQSAITRLKRSEILPTLMTLPLTPRTFLLELYHGRMVIAWRLLLLLALCLLPIGIYTGMDQGARYESVWTGLGIGVTLFACLFTAFLLYLVALSWAGLLVGLFFRKSTVALATSLAVMIALCIIPLLMEFTLSSYSMEDPFNFVFPPMYLLEICGAHGLFHVKIDSTGIFLTLLTATLLHHCTWGLILLALRKTVLAHAEPWLARAIQQT